MENEKGTKYGFLKVLEILQRLEIQQHCPGIPRTALAHPYTLV